MNRVLTRALTAVAGLSAALLMFLVPVHSNRIQADQSACTGDTWTQISSSDTPLFTGNPGVTTAIWTGSEMFVWDGVHTQGGLYSPVTNTWRSISSVGQPTQRDSFVTLWTGTEVIIWGGGLGPQGPQNTGARYNTATDTWAQMSTVNAPYDDGFPYAAVWDGTEAIILGSGSGGARYDPSSDSWTPISSPPEGPYLLGAVWTGIEMIIWGSVQNCALCGRSPYGARYNPNTDSWQSISTSGPPVPQGGPPSPFLTAVWTGSKMFVLASEGASGLYDPEADTWTQANPDGAPDGFDSDFPLTLLWTGYRVVVWGLSPPGGIAFQNTGFTYDPATDSWTPMNEMGGPPPGGYVTAWSGSQLLALGYPLEPAPSPAIAFSYCAPGAPPPCNYSLNPFQEGSRSAGGTVTISLTAASNCPWTATSAASWMSVTPMSGQGNATLTVTIAPNTNVQARTGTVSIADQTFTTTQEGAPTITNVTASGKNIEVQGQNFDPGAIVLVNGVAQKTKAQGSGSLVGKRSIKSIAKGQTASVQVQNPDGAESQPYSFVRQH